MCYCSLFLDENFSIPHNKRGVLGMANKGRHSNGSQFYITLQPAPYLDRKYVAFGYVCTRVISSTYLRYYYLRVKLCAAPLTGASRKYQLRGRVKMTLSYLCAFSVLRLLQEQKRLLGKLEQFWMPIQGKIYISQVRRCDV